MRPKGDVGHLANLHEVPEHHVGGVRREDLLRLNN
jgi:hypothetical protein